MFWIHEKKLILQSKRKKDEDENLIALFFFNTIELSKSLSEISFDKIIKIDDICNNNKDILKYHMNMMYHAYLKLKKHYLFDIPKITRIL